MRALVLLLAFLAACTTTSPPPASTASPFDEAERVSTERDLKRSRDLYREAAQKDPDPNRRDRAAIEAAVLEWHVFQNAPAANALFAQVRDTSREASRAWSERASMEIELTRDYDAARAAAAKALALAKTLTEREAARLRSARATIEEFHDKCPRDADALRDAMKQIREAIDEGGPVLESSRLLLDAALMIGDREIALQAWRWYYATLPQLVPATIGDRRSLGLALASTRLFDEAELVLRDPCASAPGPDDAEVRDVLAYAAALRKIETLTDNHHRAIAQAKEDNGAFRTTIGEESVALWNALSWPGARPQFSLEAFQKEMARRFGTVATLGNTDNIFSILLGHKVIDDTRTVEQHGRKAPLRFVSLDGMVSGGYVTWARRGETGTGGWIGSDAIYQIRPMYADGPIRRWRSITDPQVRARREEEIAEETKRDVERAKTAPIAFFRGLSLRLQQQASIALREELTARGLSGDALRDAFVREAAQNEFDASIWAHEGRHAIDKTIFKIDDSPELEFRAKISEVFFAPRPRGELGSLLSPVGPPSAHGIANKRLLEGVAAWMRAHAAEIQGLDAAAPLIPQLDKLSDAQLRAAFRSMDPLL